MPRMFRNNGLSLVLLALFIVTIGAQTVAGWRAYNAEQQDHDESPVAYRAYLATGHNVEAIFENWESEFLQAAAYIFLTAKLYQRGSAESKDPDEEEPVDEDPAEKRGDSHAPWPVRRGGLWLALYKNSLVLVYMLLFLLAIVMHAAGGSREYSAEQLQHGGQPVSVAEYMVTAQFWFESFQNWQSEFLALFTMVVFSIVLRQQGSPESKPVASPHSATGSA